MTQKLAATIIALLAFAGLVTVGTLAVFTDQEGVSANAFNTGTIDIATAPAATLVTFSGMLPGDAVTNSLTVTNQTGSSGARYSISSSATNTDTKALKDQLTLVIKTIDVTTPVTECDNFDGTQLYSGDLDNTNGKVLGDSVQGAQTGDRTLAVGATDTLCFRVSLPSSTGNGFKSATTTATFTVDAEQTANNP